MIGRWQRHYTISCVAELAQMRKAVTETLAHGVVRTVLETLVGPEFVYLGRHLAARLRSPQARPCAHSLSIRPQGIRQRFPIILRIGPGARDDARIAKQGHLDALQETDKFTERPVCHGRWYRTVAPSAQVPPTGARLA